MTDWADEIEKTIADAYSSHGAILAADADGMIAAALRKAKAEALRKAKADERKAIVLFIAKMKFFHVEHERVARYIAKAIEKNGL